MPEIKIAPSILSANFMFLAKEIKSVETADFLQIDVMDGFFVPNISFGQEVLKCIKTVLVKDVHLMIKKPERYIEDFARAGADIITIHSEATNKVKSTLKKIREQKCLAGLAIKPKTSEKKILRHAKQIDLALIMTVEPGFGGQKFIFKTLKKIKSIREKHRELDIEVDGGINNKTAYLSAKHGANIFVSGSTIFKNKNRRKAILELKKNALKGQKEFFLKQ